MRNLKVWVQGEVPYVDQCQCQCPCPRQRLKQFVQLMRISEPVLARLDDLVLDHDIPHLWVRKNSLTDRKTQASIRCVPLLGVSLKAAQELHCRAVRIVDVKQPGATPLNLPGMARWATRWSRKKAVIAAVPKHFHRLLNPQDTLSLATFVAKELHHGYASQN
jgi:hypothetical protein